MKSRIIGDGDLATALKECKREDFLFFASGVSNSREEREAEYQREKDLLMAQDKNKHLVYFSSLCVFYTDTRYAKHKKEMEELVKENFSNYTIMRLGNITFGKNPHTIINFFRNQLKKGEPLDIQDVYRYVIDKEEFLYWVDKIPDWNCEMSITGRRMKVSEIVKEYVL